MNNAKFSICTLIQITMIVWIQQPIPVPIYNFVPILWELLNANVFQAIAGVRKTIDAKVIYD